MGMYTGLRFKGIVKKEFINEIKTLFDKQDWNDCSHPKLKEFGEFERSNYIPFGGLSYMPDCWEGKPYDETKPWICPATDGFEKKFNEITGYWSFQCSLKNYGSELEYFIEEIIPLICEKVFHCEYLYEEDTVSTMYELVEGEINILPCGIRYYSEEYGYPYPPIPEIKRDIPYKNFVFMNYEEEV